MLRLFAFVLLLDLGLAANADPFAQGDPKQGKMLAEKSCVACHSSKFGGDGTQVYTRADHKVKGANQLLKQVTVCNEAAKTGWSSQAILDVAAYLNRTFYKFE